MKYIKKKFADEDGLTISFWSTDDNVLCGDGKTLRENLNNIDTRFKEKPNLNEVRLKNSSININDFDEETRKAILENNNIDVNYVLGNDAVKRDNIMNRQVTGDKLHIANCKMQYIVYSSASDGYYKHEIADIGSDATCTKYDPIRIHSGVTYYCTDVYGYFCNIKYDSTPTVYTALVKSLENGSTPNAYSCQFTATDDGYLYISAKKSKIEEGHIPMVTNSSDLPETQMYGEYNTVINSLVNKNRNYENYSVTPIKTTFVREVKQLIDLSESKVGYYKHESTITGTTDTTRYFDPIRVLKGETYYYKDLYAYFCNVKYDDGTIVAFSDNTKQNASGSITFTQNGYIYISISTAVDGKTPRLSNSPKGLETSKNGLVGNELINSIDDINNNNDNDIKINIITVKKDGTGDYTKITDAVNSINNTSIKNQYEIHIYSGVYDMVEEFGGDDWINSVSHSNGERQGLILPDYVHLIGHGSVYVNCIVEDDKATADFAKSVSTINVWQNNKLEGITFRAKNTRYVIHDETGNNFSNLTRVIKNCRFIHLGTLTDLWGSPKAMGGGLGSGGRYDIINSHFQSPFIPFSYHNNGNQDTNYINLDGCTFSGNKSTHQYDIGFGYYKKNTEKNYVTIKNCISDRPIYVHQETSSVESDNVFEVVEINNIIRG